MGVYLEIYGDNITNRVLEFLLEHGRLDSAVGDMARGAEISRPTAYEVVSEFLKKGLIRKTRIVGKTQLYTLNRDNPRVKIFERNFMECLRMVCDEYDEKGNHRPAQRAKTEILKAE